MSEPSVVSQKRFGWLAWSTRDILLIAAIGVVFGIVLTVLSYPYQLSVVLGPLVAWAWIGLYILPSFFIAYVLRRAGAAFLIAILYSLVILPFSPYGPSVLITGLMYGIGGEIAVALVTQYHRFNLVSMVITGAVGGIVLLIIYAILYPTSFNLAVPLLIGVIVVTIVSSTIGAFLAKQLADAVARTGVLSRTALKSGSLQEEI